MARYPSDEKRAVAFWVQVSEPWTRKHAAIRRDLRALIASQFRVQKVKLIRPQTVYTVIYQSGTDCEVVGVRTNKAVAIWEAKESAETLIKLGNFAETATVQVRGEDTDEVWIDLMEGEDTLQAALYTINALVVNGEFG